MMTDWTLLRRHAQYSIGAFVIFQAYVYRRNLSHTKEGFFRNFFTEEGLLDSIIFVGFVVALYGISMLFIKGSELIRGRSIDHVVNPIDVEIARKTKKGGATKKNLPFASRNSYKKKNL